jgi:hypothetical protein
MNRTLVIPDIHEKMEHLNTILTRYSDITKKVFLGDWLDSYDYHADPMDHLKVLYELLDDPNFDMVAGNHDLQYLFPKVQALGCSGWREINGRILNATLKPEHRRKMEKLHIWVDTEGPSWLLSHAGFHPKHAVHPVLGATRDHINQISSEAIGALRRGEMSRLVAAGRLRGGREDVGGVTWLDWNEFQVVRGINQIVGHTHNRKGKVRFREGTHSMNWCIDTGLQHVAIIEPDGKVIIEDI